MKYKTEGTVTVGQNFKFEAINCEGFPEMLDVTTELIDQHHTITDYLLRDKIGIGEVKKSESSIVDFEEVDEGVWNIEMKAIYDVSFELDSKSCNEDLTHNKVVKLLNQHQKINDYTYKKLISIVDVDKGSTVMNDFRFEENELDNSSSYER